MTFALTFRNGQADGLDFTDIEEAVVGFWLVDDDFLEVIQIQANVIKAEK